MDRTDPFEEWWDARRPDWEELTIEERDRLWSLCRLAWYDAKRLAEQS